MRCWKISPKKNPTQIAEAEEVDEGYRTFCPAPPPCPAPIPEPSAEDLAAWQEIERRAAGEPRVQSREVQLRPPPEESPPGVLCTVEDEEAEAIRAEAYPQPIEVNGDGRNSEGVDNFLVEIGNTPLRFFHPC